MEDYGFVCTQRFVDWKNDKTSKASVSATYPHEVLQTEDFALLYRVLPKRAKKYIVKEKLHKGFKIKADELEILNKFSSDHKVKNLEHKNVYGNMVNNWRSRRTRYSRMKSY